MQMRLPLHISLPRTHKKSKALVTIVQSRETTSRQILRLYEKMYDDVLRLHEVGNKIT